MAGCNRCYTLAAMNAINQPSELRLARDLNRLLGERRITVAVPEGSTGGRIGERLVRYAGSTVYFKGSVVTYDYSSRTRVLGVDEGMLKRHGAVNEESVRAAAEAVHGQFDANIGLASSGAAGPTGKNVGLVWLAVATDDGTTAEAHRVSARSRLGRQAEFTRLALALLWRAVGGPPVPEP
jgi:PncC family amidohydrolase